MKFVCILIAIIACFLSAGFGYVAGHIRGYGIGARSEMLSSMTFHLFTRMKIEKGDAAAAVGVIDKALASQSSALIKLKEYPALAKLEVLAIGNGQADSLAKNFPDCIRMQKNPLPPEMYRLFDMPVVKQETSVRLPAINPSSEGGASPAGAPDTRPLPPGIFKRQ